MSGKQSLDIHLSMNFPSVSEINSKYKYLFCRLCLCNSGAIGTLCDIHASRVEQGFTAANVISYLLGIEVSTTDGYPQLVCMECLMKLCEFKRFKDKCLNAKTNFEMGLHSNTILLDVCNPEQKESSEQYDDEKFSGAAAKIKRYSLIQHDSQEISSSNYLFKNNPEQHSNASTKENVEGSEFTSEYYIKEEIDKTSELREENQTDDLSLDPHIKEDLTDPLSLDPCKEECNQVDSQKMSSVECSDCQAHGNLTKCLSCCSKQQAMERTSMCEYPVQDPHLLQQTSDIQNENQSDGSPDSLSLDPLKEECNQTSDIQNENQSDGSPDSLSLDPLKEECNQTSDIQNENQSDGSPDSLSLDHLKEECNQDDNQKTSSVECSDCQAQSNSTKCVSCYLKQQAMERTSMYEYPIQDPHLLQQNIGSLIKKEFPDTCTEDPSVVLIQDDGIVIKKEFPDTCAEERPETISCTPDISYVSMQESNEWLKKGDLLRERLTHLSSGPGCSSDPSGNSILGNERELIISNQEKIGNVAAHMMIDKVEKVQKRKICNLCNKSFTKLTAINNHMLRAHAEKKFHCSACPKSFPTEDILKKHAINHREHRPFQCKICKCGFYKEELFVRHNARHGLEVPFKCDHCGKTFDHKRKLWLHIHRSHLIKHACSICNKEFSTSAYLRVHMTIHTGEKNHMCEVCGKTFRQRNTYKIHIRQHTGEKPYHCALCDRRFTQQVSMKAHMKLHHP